MRTIPVRKLEWDEGDKDRLIWKFPEKSIIWNSTLVLKENQAAAILTGHEFFSKRLQMHDVFTQAGEYILSPNTIPLLAKGIPEVVSRTLISCLLVYCSTKEHLYCPKVHTRDASGQAWVDAEAAAQCKFKITNAEKFLKNVVADHKKTSNDAALTYLDESLGDELFRQQPPYS